MFKSQKSELWQCHGVQVSDVSIVQVADRRSGPKIGENGPKWLQNGRDLRIGPCESPSHFLASGTGPVAQNRQNRAQTPDQPPPAAAMLRDKVVV